MGQDDLTTKLGDYIEDAHAMESNVLQMLSSMIATTGDAQIRRELEQHRKQTERHQERLRARLDQLGRGTSKRKEAQTLMGALMKGVTDQVRGDKAGKNARDGFVTEHMEIAAYSSLSGWPSGRATLRPRRSRGRTAATKRRWRRRSPPSGTGSST